MVRVVTAQQSAARDAAAIAAGIPSFELMRRAGFGAARVIRDRRSHRPGAPVVVFAGPGNNGGDGWIVAEVLATSGAAVHVVAVGESRTDDARAAREAALPHVSLGAPREVPSLVIDAVLGTGARGALRAAAADAAAAIARYRREGARVVALDLPTGLDATSGALAEGAVDADVTVSFGTIKRGHLLRRASCGEVVVLDIGLGSHADLADGAPPLADVAMVRATVPAIAADAHKGTRRRVLMVGGAEGMAGAVTLAARAAFRSGVGMVRVCVAPASMAALQAGAIEATATAWPAPGDAPDSATLAWPDAMLVGPGLGEAEGVDESRRRVEQWLAHWRGPAVLDADALNAFAGDTQGLGDLLSGRPAVLTPHPAELSRLAGVSVDEVRTRRFEIGASVARATGAVVLLKGTPTVVTSPDGASVVTATGTPVLATAGSGDLLGGIVTTLLAQSGDPFAAAWCAAWVHGRAAEIAGAGRPTRGVVLDDVLQGLALAWRFDASPEAPGVLTSLPRIGDA